MRYRCIGGDKDQPFLHPEDAVDKASTQVLGASATSVVLLTTHISVFEDYNRAPMPGQRFGTIIGHGL